MREPRSPERLRAHYELEKTLAAKLKSARREQRLKLYAQVYDELFRSLPDHPQHRKKLDHDARSRDVERQLQMLGRWLRKDAVFLELGAGDCALSLAACRFVSRVIAVDVSETIAQSLETPRNFELIISDGISIPVSDIDVVYSNQLMEHIHPDDAVEQLKNIASALAPGGVYICVTPNKLLGPHDISKHFDDEASGFHLKEYTARDLAKLFRAAGFQECRSYVRVRGQDALIPTSIFIAFEWLCSYFPRSMLKRRPFRALLSSVTIVGCKRQPPDTSSTRNRAQRHDDDS